MPLICQKRFYYWKKLHKDCSKYVGSCAECQQVTLKEHWYVNLHLPILQFPMAFISMDLLGPYSKTESGNQYMLTNSCILTNYVFIIRIRTKTTEDVINAYMPTLFKLLMPNIWYMGDENCHVHLDAMRKIHMMMVLNLKTVRVKCPPLIIDLPNWL